jgi:predicted esterase
MSKLCRLYRECKGLVTTWHTAIGVKPNRAMTKLRDLSGLRRHERGRGALIEKRLPLPTHTGVGPISFLIAAYKNVTNTHTRKTMKQPKLNIIWPWLILGLASSTAMAAPRIADVAKGSLSAVTIADVPMLIAAPPRITNITPLIIMYHGFGAPNSPDSLAEILPPIANALTVYPTLPIVGKRMPPGGVDELLRRQRQDYIGQLLYPSILGAAHELPRIINALSKTYGLSKSSPIILFGFSAGGAAVLLGLAESDVHPRAVLVVNAPLSIAQAAAGYERQTKGVYAWTEEAKEASRHYDIERDAERILESNPRLALLILQSELDAGPTVQAAHSAASALKSAALRYNPDPDIRAKMLPGADHHVLAGPESTTTKSMITAWLTQHAF